MLRLMMGYLAPVPLPSSASDPIFRPLIPSARPFQQQLGVPGTAQSNRLSASQDSEPNARRPHSNTAPPTPRDVDIAKHQTRPRLRLRRRQIPTVARASSTIVGLLPLGPIHFQQSPMAAKPAPPPLYMPSIAPSGRAPSRVPSDAANTRRKR